MNSYVDYKKYSYKMYFHNQCMINPIITQLISFQGIYVFSIIIMFIRAVSPCRIPKVEEGL